MGLDRDAAATSVPTPPRRLKPPTLQTSAVSILPAVAPATDVRSQPVAPAVDHPVVRRDDRPPESTTAAAPAAEPAAELVGVSRRFDDVVALDDVSLRIRPGSLVGVIGPSGAGKTTAVRLLTGGLRPTGGTVRVLGEEPTAMRPGTRERIGFMPQQVSLYEDLTAAENLDFVASLFGSLLFERRRRIRQVLDWLELGDARNRRAAALSGGMQRRLQLGCALVHDPDLVFLDEPTAGVDPLLRQTIWTELRRLRDAGRTLLATTQYVGEAEECDEVALIADGRLVAFAPPAELRALAFGGELLEVETSGILDAASLERHPLIQDVQQVGPRRVVVVTTDAATATPALVAAIEAAGTTITSIGESRPSFDEVFARLVQGRAA